MSWKVTNDLVINTRGKVNVDIRDNMFVPAGPTLIDLHIDTRNPEIYQKLIALFPEILELRNEEE